MPQTSNISVVILAAGASTRMGSPKQLLKWGNTTLIQNAIATAKDIQAKEIIVVLGANAEVITSKIKDESISFILNEEWIQGLGESIAYASNYILNSEEKTDGILIMLADQPFVSSIFLNKILNLFKSNTKQIIATSYSTDKKGVPALFDKHYLTELSLLKGDEGAKSILEKHKSYIDLVVPDFDNIDIDTSEDYKKYFNKKKG